jgi:uncharacterized membrane protein YkgB
MRTFTARAAEPAARVALFIIYFWFGILKVFGTSPASPLVRSLLAHTLPFISPNVFCILFGAGEAILGILFLFRKCDRVAIPLFFLHMIAAFLPLVVLPGETWTSFMTPTLEGQYIVKNVALIAIVLGLMERRNNITAHG